MSIKKNANVFNFASAALLLVLSSIFLSESSAGNNAGSESDRDIYVMEQLKSFFSPQAHETETRLQKSRDTSRRRMSREMTHLLKYGQNHMDHFSDENQAYLKTFFKRPTDADYDEEHLNSGWYLPGEVSSFEPSEDAYPNTGGKVKFWYVTHDQPDPDGNVHQATVEYVLAVARSFEHVYQREIIDMNYPVPPDDSEKEDNGGDGKLDIYIMDCVKKGYYGYVIPGGHAFDDETGRKANALYSFMVIDNDYQNLPREDLSPEDAMKVTLAHEYHHVIQFGINGDASDWFCESTSTWIENEIYDRVNNNSRYIDNFLNNPDTSLDKSSDHWYGAWIWNEYLKTRWGAGIIKDIWNTMDPLNSNNALDATTTELMAKNVAFESVFADFISKNYSQTGFYDDDIIQGNSGVYTTKSHTLNMDTTEVSWQNLSVDHLASHYVRLKPSIFLSTPVDLTIAVDGTDNSEISAVAIVKKTDDTFEENPFELPAPMKKGVVVIENFHRDTVSEVVLAVLNHSTGRNDLDVRYSATLENSLDDFIIDPNHNYEGEASYTSPDEQPALYESDNSEGGCFINALHDKTGK